MIPANENAPECYQHSKASETSFEASPFIEQDSSAPVASQAPRVLVCDKYDEGGTSTGAGAGARDLDAALTKAWVFDAHCTQYDSPVRINKAMVRETPMVMRVAMFDFDTPGHVPIAECPEFADPLVHLPTGFLGYATAGGFRCMTLLPEPFVVDSPERWEQWRAWHAGMGQALAEALERPIDEGCSEPARLFRLPNVRRRGKPCYPDLYGALGTPSLTPRPVPVKPAIETYEGDAAATKLGAVFKAAGLARDSNGQKLIVTCPWVHEHSGQADTGTFIDDDETGLGHFVCMHAHCRARHSNDALKALQGLPAAAAELAHWPEPTHIFDRYTRVAMPPAAVEAPSSVLAFKGDLATSALRGAVRSPRPWVAQALGVAPGRPTILAGYGATKKTLTLEALLLSAASGRDLFGFGEGAVKQGRAVYYSAEQDGIESLRRLEGLALGAGLTSDEFWRLIDDKTLIVVAFPQLNFTPSRIVAFKKELSQLKGFVLCGIDSLVAMTPGLDENKDEVSQGLRELADVSATTGCAFVVTAHTTKSSLQVQSLEASEWVGALKGSASLFNAAANIVQFGHYAGELYLVNTKNSLGTPRPPMRLTTEFDGGEDGVTPTRIRIESSDAVPLSTKDPMECTLDEAWPLIEKALSRGTVSRAGLARALADEMVSATSALRKLSKTKRGDLADRLVGDALAADRLITVSGKIMRSYAHSRETEVQETEEKILTQLRPSFSSDGQLTRSQLEKNLTGRLQRHFSEALNNLETAGRITRRQVRRGNGRDAEVFTPVPMN